MSIKSCKRGGEHISSDTEREDDKQYQHSLLLDLPMNLIIDVLVRLPPKAICYCTCVCKMFLKILRDPYFAKIHLIKAANDSPGLILQDYACPSRFSLAYSIDNDETSFATACSIHRHNCHCSLLSHVSQALSKPYTKFEVLDFHNGRAALVDSCNGLLCLRFGTFLGDDYFVYNPILGEFMALPKLTALYSGTYLLSGFGYCPNSNQYKVIHFVRSSFSHAGASSSTETVAMIHTLGTNSWRSIPDAPRPRIGGSFGSSLNGILHWITDGATPSNLICSFKMEIEEFQSLSVPAQFNQGYVSNVPWISIGVRGGNLCLCYVLGDAQFDVWVMKDYGVKESWTKEFAIDISFYCGLRVEDFHRPIMFLNNGDLLLHYNSESIVSYNPRSGTFRDFKALTVKSIHAVAHIPSFISLKDIAKGRNVKRVRLERARGCFSLS